MSKRANTRLLQVIGRAGPFLELKPAMEGDHRHLVQGFLGSSGPPGSAC